MKRFWLFSICTLAMTLGSFAAAPAMGHSYWVWGRRTPLTAAESTELQRQSAPALYWHIGEMEIRGGKWNWKTAPLLWDSLAPDLRVIPVVRLATESSTPFTTERVKILIDDLRAIASKSGELQIDFDCPDRLLGSYAAALQAIRRAIPHLSITALTHWAQRPAFPELTKSVEEIMPMFYDMQADPTGVSKDSPPPPILDPATVEPALRTWSQCPIPWRAGLPAFARLTVFDSTGLSRGQIPNWTWDDFCFHKGLFTLAPTRLGGTLFRAASDTKVSGTPVKAGELIASRFTDREALERITETAQKAGAAGIVFFRLPDNTDPANASLHDLGMLKTASRPVLTLRQAGEAQLELVNDSPFDLPPRLSGEKGARDRGYALELDALELDAPAPIFREALAGDFWRVSSHANPDAKKPVPAPIPLATRLTLWFSHLRAGDSLRTGLLQLAPNATFENVRYRIINCEGSAEWKPISLTGTQPTLPRNDGSPEASSAGSH